MTNLPSFFTSDPFVAFLIAILIFFFTIFLSVKQWINLPLTLILLLFSLAAGTVVNTQRHLKGYVLGNSKGLNQSSVEFQDQLREAFETIKIELSAEKDSLLKIGSQVEAIFKEVENQSAKIESLFDKTREKAINEQKTVRAPE